MNLRDLKYIVTVADTLNFNRAAELCHVSQPSLSKQIQKVEEEIGVAIFERTNRKVSITPIGHHIIQRARSTLQEADAIYQIARAASDPLAGSFRLGIIATVAPYLLPRILPALRRSLPKLTLALIEGQTESLVNQLKRGELDAIVLAVPLADDELQVESLYSEPFLFAAAQSHPLAGRKRISMSDLRAEPMLLLEDGHCLRSQALQLCQRTGAQPSSDFRATSLETLRQMVAAGNGATLMPALAAEKGTVRLRYIPFKDPVPSRLIGISWRKSSPRRRLLEKLSQVIRKEMKDMPRKKLDILPIISL